MRRREFIMLVGGSAVTWPLAARAQQPSKLPTIGVLSGSTPAVWSDWTAAFVQRLRKAGWIEGRTVAIEYRWAEGRSERAPELATDLVRRKVDVIVTTGGVLLTAKQATSAIPIVFATANDPVGSGLVASLARPGGNLTGLSLQATDTAGKRLELLSEIVPSLHRAAILAKIDNPSAALEIAEARAAAQTLGLGVATIEVRLAEDISSAFEAANGRMDALYVCSDPLFATVGVRLSALALGARLPTIYGFRQHVEAGGLISYGANFPDLFRRAADYVDRILRGAKPAELPIEQPTKFDLVINLKTAKALGLAVPDKLLALADEVIE